MVYPGGMTQEGGTPMMTRTLRHDTGAQIALKTATPSMVTKVGKSALLISVGVSPIKSTTPAVQRKHLKVA